jgi:hypothetical protein
LPFLGELAFFAAFFGDLAFFGDPPAAFLAFGLAPVFLFGDPAFLAAPPEDAEDEPLAVSLKLPFAPFPLTWVRTPLIVPDFK